MRFAAEHGIHAAFFGVDSTRADLDFFRRVVRDRGRGGRARGRRRRHARHRLARRPSRSSSGGRSSGSAATCRCTSTATTTSGSPRRARSRRSAPARRWVHGTINGMGERAGNANLGEVALDAARRSTASSRTSGSTAIRDVSERVRELSGYELEPWKPLTGENAVPPRERRGREPVPRPAVDRAVLVGARRAPSAAIVLGKKSGLDSIRIKAEELGLDVPEERRAELLAAVKELGTREARARHRRRVPGARAWLTYDAVIVGSGDQRRSPAARCSRKAGWRVCVLERNDWLGGAIRTAEITEPGFLHDVFSAWHPLWVGGAAHAQLGDELARARARVPEHGAADGDALPRRRGRVPAAHGRRERGRARPPRRRRRRRLAAAARRVLPERRPRVRRARHRALVAARARRSALKALPAPRPPRRCRLRRRAARQSARDWLETTFASERAHGLLAPWVLHTGLGPDAAASGYMAQVIAVAVQEGGMPIPRGGGARLVDALVAADPRARRHLRDRRRGRARARRRAGAPSASAPPSGETVTARRAVIANVTPTQLYGRLLAGRRRASRAAKARRFRYGRSEMQIHFALSEPPRWEGDERLGEHRDRAPHAGPRRRLAGRQRGRARAAAGRGDDRRRPAADDGPVARARGARASSGSSCRSCRGT